MLKSCRLYRYEVLGRPNSASPFVVREKMAPVLEKKLLGAAGAGDTMENNNEDEEGQNLWQVEVLLNSHACAILFKENLLTVKFNLLCHCRLVLKTGPGCQNSQKTRLASCYSSKLA